MKLHPQYVRQIHAATTQADLHPVVQNAIELEHATIPPYLCGYFTLKHGHNDEVSEIIRSVVIQEMLHLTIAANLMLALGGQPSINNPKFVPDYPHSLPMGIGDDFPVHLRKCSIEQVKDTFMKIEEPEDPIDIPIGAGVMPAAAEIELPDFDTIGAFYHFLIKKIEELGDAIEWHSEQQVIASKWFPNPKQMFLINSVETAVAAINVIIDQGEGTSTDPLDASDEPAHFYRFEQIVKGRKLTKLPGSNPPKYEFGGDPIELDSHQVWDMDDDPKIANYKPGSYSHRMATQFSYSYTKLLNSLHRAFNGEPAQLDHAMGVMYELRLVAFQTLQVEAEWADSSNQSKKQTGLSFEHQPLND